MSLLRAALRTLLLVVHLGLGLLLATAVNLDFTRRLQRERLMRWWCRRLLDVLNVRVDVQGAGVEGPRVIVANHVSWLDIPVIGSLEATRFVSKSEVKDWPIAGFLADGAGAFYIRRGQGGAKPLLENLRPHLKAGGSVCFFPEGTTTAGETVLRFHPRLFSAATAAGCPVQPVALRYAPTPRGEALAPFVGDDDLVSHIARLLRARGLEVELTYLPSIPTTGREREEVAAQAHAAVRRIVRPEPVGVTVGRAGESADALPVAA